MSDHDKAKELEQEDWVESVDVDSERDETVITLQTDVVRDAFKRGWDYHGETVVSEGELRELVEQWREDGRVKRAEADSYEEVAAGAKMVECAGELEELLNG